jgi:hypothetical protein
MDGIASMPAGRGVFGGERFDFVLGGRSTRPACVL